MQNVQLENKVQPIQIKSRRTNGAKGLSGFEKLNIEVFELKSRKLTEQRQNNKQNSPPKSEANNSVPNFLKSTRIKRKDNNPDALAGFNKINTMINRNDLNIKSTKTKRATNLEPLSHLEDILSKEVTDNELFA